MPVVAILNQKGGVGKTTISTNLACIFKDAGNSTLLVDGDPQGSARDWHEANEGETIPVVGLDRETLPKDLNAIRDGYEWIIIDGAPQVSRLAAAAIKAADIVVIPCQPSPYDVWACADLVEIIKARQEVTDGHPKACFLISRKIKGTKLGKEVIEALRGYELPVMESHTSQRVAYPTTASEGNSVLDGDDDTAVEEMMAIRNELVEMF